MSWRAAAELARARAEQARRRSAEQYVEEFRIQAQEDRPALAAWLQRRIAQEFDTFANELEQAGREDVTVSERGPRR
jgi:hypothetical protein